MVYLGNLNHSFKNLFGPIASLMYGTPQESHEGKGVPMKNIVYSVLGCTLLLGNANAFGDGQRKAGIIPGEYIVIYQKGFQPVAQSTNRESLSMVETVKTLPMAHGALVRPNSLLESAPNDATFRKKLAAMPGVAYVVPNRVILARQATSSDPLVYRQYGLDVTQVSKAWEITTGSKAVTVGVIDSGVDYNHPDLADNIWNNPGETGVDAQGRDKRTNGIDDDNNGYVDDWHGWNFAKGNNNPMDENGHGTHCAATIGARGDNGVGMAGLNWNVGIVPLKFMDRWGAGTLDAAVEAVSYAIKMKLNITSNSWGGPGDLTEKMLWTNLFSEANSVGQLIVIAAGNESGNNDEEIFNFPATIRLNNVMVVAASDPQDKLARFTNYGEDSVDIAAPGVGILSAAIGDGYVSMDGTSMATPFVAGAAALVKAANPNATPEEIRQRIDSSVDLNPMMSGLLVSGGRLNIGRAVSGDTSSKQGLLK